MSIEEFFQACQRHDWTYEYSDDHSVWERGRRSKAALESGASEDPVKATILHDFRAYVFSGESFGKPKAPKPNILASVPPGARKVSRALLAPPPVARAVVVDALRVRAMD